MKKEMTEVGRLAQDGEASPPFWERVWASFWRFRTNRISTRVIYAMFAIGVLAPLLANSFPLAMSLPDALPTLEEEKKAMFRELNKALETERNAALDAVDEGEPDAFERLEHAENALSAAKPDFETNVWPQERARILQASETTLSFPVLLDLCRPHHPRLRLQCVPPRVPALHHSRADLALRQGPDRIQAHITDHAGDGVGRRRRPLHRGEANQLSLRRLLQDLGTGGARGRGLGIVASHSLQLLRQSQRAHSAAAAVLSRPREVSPASRGGADGQDDRRTAGGRAQVRASPVERVRRIGGGHRCYRC